MMTDIHTNNQNIWDTLLKLKKESNEVRKIALQRRISTQPYSTDFEYILGAFIEMYEPYLYGVVRKLFKKGYALDVSSGFCGKFAQYQSINGVFSFDYVTKNRLEKEGVTQREFEGLKSLVFWPTRADIPYIKRKLFQLVELLPDRGVLKVPTNSYSAREFRRKFIPKDPGFRKTMLFERLQHKIQSEVNNAVKKRIEKNPTPTSIECSLGVFIESLEPQVKKGVLALHQKGYSIDFCGFSNNPCDQVIEGDFQLSEQTISQLFSRGVTVEITGSGYTKIYFKPEIASVNKIQEQWISIVATLPDTHQKAMDSMTRQAREF